MPLAITLLFSFVAGLLLYAGLPVVLAQVYPIRIRKRIGDAYFWLSMHSFRRLNILRKILGGYALHPLSKDGRKKTGTFETHEEQHVEDPLDTVDRIYGKPILVQLEAVPAATNATLCELGEAWHKHVQRGDAVQEDTVESPDGDSFIRTKVNPYFPVPSGNRVVDPKDWLALVMNDANPDDVAKAEAYTEKSQEGFRDSVGAVETMALLIGFIGALGTVVGIQKYILKNVESGGGGGGVPNPPIDLGMIAPMQFADLAAAMAVMPL